MPLINEEGIPTLLGRVVVMDVYTKSMGYLPLYANLEVWVVGNARCPVYWPAGTGEESLNALTTGIREWERSLPPEEPTHRHKVQGISILPGMLIFLEMEIKETSQVLLVANVDYKEDLDEETKGYCLAVRAGLYEHCEEIPFPE